MPSASYEVSADGVLTVDWSFPAPTNTYEYTTGANIPGVAGSVSEEGTVSVGIGDDASETVTLDLGEIGIGPGDTEQVSVTTTLVVSGTGDLFDQIQDTVEVSIPGDPTDEVSVDILSTGYDASTEEIVVTAGVSITGTGSFEYDLEISDGRGNSITLPPTGSAQLDGGASPLPGDSNSHEARFPASPGDSGEATAQVVGEPGLSASASWSVEDDDPGGFDPDNVHLVGCETRFPSIEPGGQIHYTIDLANTNSADADVTLGFNLNGVRVGSNTFTIFDERSLSISLPEDDFTEYASSSQSGLREYDLSVEILSVAEA